MSDEMRKRVAKILHETARVRTCALYDPGETCGHCTLLAGDVLAALDLDGIRAEERRAGRQDAAAAIIAHRDERYPLTGNMDQIRARRHLNIAVQVAAPAGEYGVAAAVEKLRERT